MFTSHDIQLLLVDLALILALARIFGWLARRLGQPPVIGEIIAGILLGPTFFSGAIARNLFPTALRNPLTSIADVGLVLFMFIVGYELDQRLIRGRERIAARVSLGSIALPMLGGVLLGVWLAHRHGIHRVVPFALFVGASMSVTAFPVLARILTDRGMHRTRLGGLAIASAAVDDIAAWSILAVVVTIAGATGSNTWHVVLAPAYLLIMWFAVRPAMAWVARQRSRTSRLTPDLLAVVLVGLLLSACATEWMGVHFIFGAFIFGVIMPRRDGEQLRVDILERLEQLSVLLLLPVFFVIAGLGVNLTKITADEIGELFAILAVAIGGKFIGAYLGALSCRVPPRQSGALATLMNTRGLTELIILTVGLQLGVLDVPLYSLMVVMAVVTTSMTGPLLRLIYPPRLIERDIADADRAILSAGAAYRVLVVIDDLEDVALVDLAADLAAARAPGEVVLSRLVRQAKQHRLEVGTGLGNDLLAMTSAMGRLHDLAGRAQQRGVATSVYSRFSEQVAEDLTTHVLAAEPDLLVLPAGIWPAANDRLPRTVEVLRLPGSAAAVAVAVDGGADAAAALQVATQLAVGRGVPLVLDGSGGRRERAARGELAKRGIDVRTGEAPPGALLVGTPADADGELRPNVLVRARRDDEVDNIEDWADLVSAEGQ